MKNRALYKFALALICLFSFLMKDVETIVANEVISLNYIDIISSSEMYDTYNNRAVITILSSDLKGLDYKRSTITLKNRNDVEEIISLYDGKVVELNNTNYIYSDYNTSGYIGFEIMDNTLKIYIAARESDNDLLDGNDVTLDYKVYLVNSCNQSDEYIGEFTNKYIDYKIVDYDLDESGVELNLSFDSRDSTNKKINRSIYNSDTYEVNVVDYYGNLNTLEFVLDGDYDAGTNIIFDKLNNVYGELNIEISKVPYNIIVAEEFYDDVYITQDDILNKIDNDLVDFSNISYYLDNNGYYRFYNSSITINLKSGLHLVYRIDSGAYDDFAYYTENSYLIDGERSIEEYMEDYEYISRGDETLIIDIIEGSPMLDYIQIGNSAYSINTDRISVANNNSFNVKVTVHENTVFKYKYVDYNGDEIIKDIKIDSIIAPNPVIKFGNNVESYNIDSDETSYLYGEVNAYVEDMYFEYVDKSTGLPLSYTFNSSTSNSYTIDKDNVKILYNGVETDLILEEDIVIELPIDKLVSIEDDNNISNQEKETQTDNKKLEIGAIIAIVVASLVVIGSGLFVVIWFVIKKKTWEDFIAIFNKK